MPIIPLNSHNFEQEIGQNTKVIVDFWADWCGPCKMLAPILEEISEESETSVPIYKVNIDDQPQLAAKFGIMSIPTLVLIEKGAVKAKLVGVQPKEAILKMMQ